MLAEHISCQIPLVILTTGSSSEVNDIFPYHIVPGKAPDRYALLAKRDVKMAGYWLSSFFAFLSSDWLSKRAIKTRKKNEVNVQSSWPNRLGQQRIYYMAKKWTFSPGTEITKNGPHRSALIRFILPNRRSSHCNKLTFRYSSNLWHWQVNTIRAFHLKVMSGLTWFPFSAGNVI